MSTKAQRDSWTRTRALGDVYNCGETLDLALEKFYNGEIDEIFLTQLIELTRKIYEAACCDLHWDRRWDRKLTFHLHVKPSIDRN